jgi:predicted enzyme related to lactoylglutathione lyase
MAHIDNHPAGNFCWIELATTDQSAAKTFYGQLFGWDVQDAPMGPDAYYSIFKLDGRDVAAGCTMFEEQKAQGVPPHWSIYISTPDADQTVKRVGELGGSVLAPAFDVFDMGRMAILLDPTGAVFRIWQPRRLKGLGITSTEGALCWADLSTPDPDRAKTFYGDLFGWKVAVGENDSSGYLHIVNDREMIGGIPPTAHRDPKIPPHWLIYFQVADCKASAAKAKELGATYRLPPMFMERVGTIAVLADPQGATFALFQPLPRNG